MTSVYRRIYLVRNMVNGKMYVGQTRCSVAQRWSQHSSKSRNHGRDANRHLASAILKYGAHCFNVFEICSASSVDELNSMEIEEIARHGSLDRRVGYNIRPGGGFATHSTETRELLRAANLGKKASDETRKNISEGHMGQAPWNKGMPMTEEAKDKLRATNTGKKASEGTKNKIRDAHLGRVRSPEEIKKSADSRRGAKRSPEMMRKVWATRRLRELDKLHGA